MEFLLGLPRRFFEKFVDLYVSNWEIILRDLGIIFLVLLGLMMIEIFYKGYQSSTFKRFFISPNKGTVTDIVLFLLHHTSLMVFIAAVMSFGIPFLISQKMRTLVDFNLGGYLSPTFHFVLFFIVLDFLNYWQHRMLYEVPGLWDIHKLHHSCTEMNFVTVAREHPLDKALNAITTAIAIIITGVPTESFNTFILIAGIYGLLKHSSFIQGWGWFGCYVLQSPKDHWIHHSPDKEHWDKNYANNLAIWDHVFGTYYKGNNVNTRVGLPSEDINTRNVFGAVWYCYVGFLKNMYRLVTSPKQYIQEYKNSKL